MFAAAILPERQGLGHDKLGDTEVGDRWNSANANLTLGHHASTHGFGRRVSRRGKLRQRSMRRCSEPVRSKRVACGIGFDVTLGSPHGERFAKLLHGLPALLRFLFEPFLNQLPKLWFMDLVLFPWGGLKTRIELMRAL